MRCEQVRYAHVRIALLAFSSGLVWMEVFCLAIKKNPRNTPSRTALLSFKFELLGRCGRQPCPLSVRMTLCWATLIPGDCFSPRLSGPVWIGITRGPICGHGDARERRARRSRDCGTSSFVVGTRGFGIMIRIKHRFVSSGILLAATSYVHQSFHEEPEHEVSFPAVSSVLLSHWMARRFPRIYPDIPGYIPDSPEKPGF